MTRPNLVNTNYTYDTLSRLLSVVHQQGLIGAGTSYTYDAVGNRTARTDFAAGVGQVVQSYTYDPIYQLTQAVVSTVPPTTTETYTYDKVGNRLSSLGVPALTYNSSNQLLSAQIAPLVAANFTYDANGNTLTRSAAGLTTSNGWDFENRLTSVTLPGTAGTVAFKYDPFGRRIQKSSVAGTTNYVYDGDNAIEELNATGAVTAQYTQGLGIDEPLAMYRAGAVNFYHADGLGSIAALTDTTGSPAAAYVYDSFGNTITVPGSVTNPFRYTAREFDSETGLYYYRARYYDSAVGRFLSEDPIRFAGGLDFYHYVFNDPADLGDPFGLDANTWTYGEIRSWAIGPPPGYAPPSGLGDAKASIGAVCSLNGVCADKDGSRATNPRDRAAWRNITAASGTDRSGGGNFMCVGTQECWFVTKCYKCVKGRTTKVSRPVPLQPSGTVGVAGNTLYFYKDPLRGWCDDKDFKSGCCGQ